MKNTVKGSLPNIRYRYVRKKFRTFFRTFPHFTVLWVVLFDLKGKMKNAGIPLVSGLPALYPGRESNSYARFQAQDFKSYNGVLTAFNHFANFQSWRWFTAKNVCRCSRSKTPLSVWSVSRLSVRVGAS